jgi:hypothetical protein
MFKKLVITSWMFMVNVLNPIRHGPNGKPEMALRIHPVKLAGTAIFALPKYIWLVVSTLLLCKI